MLRTLADQLAIATISCQYEMDSGRLRRTAQVGHCIQKVSCHFAPITPRAIDDRTAGQLGYLVSQRLRKRVEEIFGWWKTVARLLTIDIIRVLISDGWGEPSST